MDFEQWYEKNCIKNPPGNGMYLTETGEWVYKEDCKEIWDSICTALSAPSPKPPVDALITVANNEFTRAWINLEKFPGGMMDSNRGIFGPVPGSTSCWITTSEKEAERMRGKGPVLEIFTHPASEPKALTADRLSQIAIVVKDVIETLMLWNGQASAGLDVNGLAGLRDELVVLADRGSEGK